jgi:hypothetical protein
MKNKILLLGVFLIFSLASVAKQIDENTAKLAGTHFLSQKSSSNALSLELVYTSSSHNGIDEGSEAAVNYFYVFNSNTKGFVIVSGDDIVIPILGYSCKGVFDVNNIPQNVAKWLEGYKSEIRAGIQSNIQPTKEIEDEWKQLKNGTFNNSSAKDINNVNPLMQTQWNQSPFYNSLCPGGSVTGCVATAMAQIMKYWNYPATGTGFHSYNHQSYGTLSANFGGTSYQWASMPNSVNSSNNAVATLMYHAGVSVDMDYSPESSGAYVISDLSPVTNCAEYALETYFGYSTSLQGVQKSSYTQSQWLNLIKSELDASRPVLFAGIGTGGGHCFVADGYDNNDYIHFNWGWGGYSDGYFQINALNPAGTGIGGGDGGYNSDVQAVIGIEPPASSQGFDMALYDFVTPSSNTIYYGQAFDVSTNILNNGTNTFNGDYTAAIFDNNYNFIDYVQTLSGYSLQGGYIYSNNLTFATTGILGMVPGTYYVGIFYRPTGGNWVQVADYGSYSNLVQMTVINPNDIELNSSFVLTPGIVLTQGQSASANVNVVNNGANTFTGLYNVSLYNLDGTLAQSFGDLNESNGLPSGYTYNSPYLSFSTTSVNVNPGTYLLALQHNPNNTGWQLTGSTNFTNPITVTVAAPGIQPDIYEVNNIKAQAYNLPITFSGNSATKNTTGSNCHNPTDVDFYKIILPSGYNYTITPRIHDSYNSGNGNTYTLDGLFSYSTDGVTWSTAFDDVMPGNITLNGGGTIYFKVASYFAGETGTYLLSMSLTRSASVEVSSIEMDNTIKIYPNPAKEFVMIDLNEFNGQASELHLINTQGQFVTSIGVFDEAKTINLPLSNYSEGIYFLQILTDKGILNKKIIISK